MRWSEIPFHPPLSTLRWFAGFGTIALLGLATVQYLHAENDVLALVFLGLAIAAGLLGLIAPARLRPVFVGMMVVSYPLNWLVTHLILAFLFYCVFTSVGLIFKLIGRDALNRRLEPESASYWIAKPPARGIRSYFRQS
jgi:Saxitoxin biosynthesis operon protein SxtJ